MPTPWERYQADLQRDDFVEDAAQTEAVRRLDSLHDRLAAADPPAKHGLRGWWNRVRGVPAEPVRGLYLWGGVGRGKTYLVDTFFDCLPFEARRRLHFHRFMREVHGRLRTWRDRENPLDRVAAEWATDTRVLCFDEFYVSDIADAMILSGLLHGLFSRGVSLVATSNIAPDDLYRDGLQRERFLPAIDLIKRNTDVLNVAGATDYRLRHLEGARLYHSPLSADVDARLAREVDRLLPDNAPVHDDTLLSIEGRKIPARRESDGVVWFDFQAICDGPRSQADYMEVARCYHTVAVSNVPVLARDREDQARRFISLVDEFYDRGVKLLLSAAAAPDELYRGNRLGFEFQRTVSRLTEMQSHDYLSAPHRP